MNNAVLDVSDDVLQEILQGDHPVNKRLRYLRDARRAERSKDWASAIKYLRCEQHPTSEQLRHLRKPLGASRES